MSNRARGALLERRAEAFLKAKNLLVHRTRAGVRFVRKGVFTKAPNDLWGVFDLAAIEPATGRIRLIQVTEQSNAAHRRAKVHEWAKDWFLSSMIPQLKLEVWAWGNAKKGPETNGSRKAYRVSLYTGAGNWYLAGFESGKVA